MSNIKARAEQFGIESRTVLGPNEIKRVEVSDRDKRKLRNAVEVLVTAYPFLGSLASSDSISYHAVEPGQPFTWAATDALGIYLATGTKGFFADAPDGLTDGNRVFVVGHEILHGVLESIHWKHIHETQGWVPVPRSTRWPDGMAPYDERVWQHAEDARINAALIADRVGDPPPTIYTHPSVTFTTPFGEAYAAVFPPPPPPGQGNSPQQQPNQGQQGGQGQGGQPNPGGQQPKPAQGGGNDVLKPGQGGDAQGDDSTPKDTTQAAADLAKGASQRQAAVNRAAAVARQAGQGGSAVEGLVIAAREPGVDWRSYVPGFLARAAGNSAYDPTRPARPPLMRSLMGLDNYYAPARGAHACETVVFVGDISGSIQPREHRAILGAISEMLTTLRPRNTILIWCDDRIRRVDEVDVENDFSEYNIPRGGGTDFHPPFRFLAEKGIKPDGLIYFTDFYGDAPVEDPGYPVLWLHTVADKKRPDSGGQWGEVVHVPVHELHGE